MAYYDDMSENPVGMVLLRTRASPAMQIMLVGGSDEYPIIPPMDEYLIAQMVEDQWVSSSDVALAVIRAVQEDVFAGGGGAVGPPGYAGWQVVVAGAVGR